MQIVIFPGFQIVDAAGPIAAFEIAARYVPGAYTLKLVAVTAGLIPSSSGIAMPAATEMIMATLPPARAGVGSAVNDTVREFGGALGVAVIGSVAATSYATSMQDKLADFPTLSDVDRTLLTNNVGAAIHAGEHLGAQAGQIATAARDAFVDSMHSSLWIAVGLAFCAAAVTFTQLPRQAAHHAAHGGHGSHSGHAAVAHGHHVPHVATVEAATSTEVATS